MENLINNGTPEIFSDKLILDCILFNDILESDLGDLVPFFEIRTFEIGEKFTPSIENDPYFFLLFDGIIETCIENTQADTKEKSILDSGNFLGEMNLFFKDYYKIQCHAIEKSKILLLTKKKFIIMTQSLLHGANQFHFNLIKVLSKKADELNDEFINLFVHQLDNQNQE